MVLQEGSAGAESPYMVMKIAGKVSPFISSEIALRSASAFCTLSPVSRASLISVAEAARSKCTSMEQPRSITLLTVAMMLP